MFDTLYKRSHLIASGILAIMITIGSAAAVTVKGSVPHEPAAGTVQHVGRFVVGPTSAVFVPAVPERPTEVR